MSDQDTDNKKRINNYMEMFRLGVSTFSVSIFSLIIWVFGIADCRVWQVALGWILGAVVQYFINTRNSRNVPDETV